MFYLSVASPSACEQKAEFNFASSQSLSSSVIEDFSILIFRSFARRSTVAKRDRNLSDERVRASSASTLMKRAALTAEKSKSPSSSNAFSLSPFFTAL